MKKHFTLLAALLLITIASWAQIVGGVPEAERNALIALYDATNGEGWANKTSWKTDADVEFWYGVTVANGHVTELDLAGNQLMGSIPSSIGNLTSLLKLDLCLNRLSGTIPTTIGNLTSLTSLDLTGNELSGTIPDEIGALSALTSLYMGRNHLSGSIPSSLGGLSNIEFLELYVNNLSGIIPAELGNLTLLKALDLSNNLLTGAVPASFAQLSNMYVLFLENNKLTEVCDLSSLTNLSGIYIHNNLLGFSALAAAKVTVTAELSFGYTPQRNPRLTSAASGGSLTLTMPEAMTGNVYRWFNGDTEIPGQTGQSLTIPATQVGAYYCKATNPAFPELTLCSAAEDVGGTISHGIATDEYAVLRKLYESTNGPEWFRNSGWNTDEPVANWRDVQVDGVHVTALLLSYNNLTGVIPAEVGSLTKLKSFILTGNNLTGTIPSEMGNLAELTYLNLRENRMSGAIPQSIGNLTNLKNLDLRINELSGSIPSALGNLTQLQSLYLNNNQLTGAIPSSLGNLTLLKNLYLGSNRLSGTVPSSFGNIASLNDLRMENNLLSGSLPAEMGTLGNLTKIYLHKNNLSGLCSLPIDAYGDLSENYLDYDDLTTSGIGSKYYCYNQGQVVLSRANSTLTIPGHVEGNVYTWYKNNVGNGQVLPTFTATENGSYYCKITNPSFPSLPLLNTTEEIVTVGVATYTLTANAKNKGTIAVDGGAYTAPLALTTGTAVKVVATPNPGYLFVGWGGSVNATTAEVTITMDASKLLVAKFIPIPSRTLFVVRQGSGSVTVDGEAYTAPLSYIEGTATHLKATPAAGYLFKEWKGASTSTSAEVDVTLDVSKTMVAIFEPISHSLTVTTVGSGSVTVNGQAYTSPLSLVENSSAALKATPASGYTFTGWSGAATSTDAEVSLTMNAPKAITATFTAVTSVVDEAIGEVKVYPNPFSDALQFENEEAVRRVTIVNMVGQVVMVVNGSVSSIKTNELRAGIYLIKIEDINGSCITRRLVKK